MATKTPKTPEEIAAENLAKLQKTAKKLKIDFAGVPASLLELQIKAKGFNIDFDKETTEAELTILVNAAEAAAKAQKEKEAGDAGTAPIVALEDSNRDDVKDAQAQADSANAPQEVTPAGDTVVQTVITKNKEKHHLVVTPKGDVQIKNHFGIVTANFAASDDQSQNVNEGKRHLENLSRF